jgi:predicted acyl esterase
VTRGLAMKATSSALHCENTRRIRLRPWAPACRMVPPLRCYVLFLLLFLSLLSATSLLRAQMSTDTVIVMRDGVILDATVMLPASSPPVQGFPGIVLVHGYAGSKDDMVVLAVLLASKGFASLAYSVRGQGNSGGLSTTSGPVERLDLGEVIQFFRSFRDVDSNRIGVAGGSQGGIHSWMAAVYRMPGVRAVAPVLATPRFASDLVPNGCVKNGLVHELTLESVRYSPIWAKAKEYIIQDLNDSLLVLTRERDLDHLVDSVQVPVIQGLGWADELFPANAAIGAAAQLSARGIPIWSYYGTNGHGEENNLDEAIFVLGKTIEWFNHWLQDSALAMADVPMVFYADDRPGWPHHETSEWPPKPVGTLRLYLTLQGLSTALPTEAGVLPFSLDYDTSYSATEAWDDRYQGPRFQSAFRSSPARLLSPPLPDTTEVTGIPKAHLMVSGDMPNFQSHIRLFDVSESDTGHVWQMISRGTAGNRGVLPSSVREIDLECQAFSHFIPAGHRVGVEITSLDDVGTDEAYIIPFFVSTQSALATSAAYPSYVDLPIVGLAPILGVGEPPSLASSESRLFPNYPNPFNASTNIRFSVARPLHVTLTIFDALGRGVATLIDGPTASGEYLVRFEGDRLASGVYFCQLIAGSEISVRKILLLR